MFSTNESPLPAAPTEEMQVLRDEVVRLSHRIDLQARQIDSLNHAHVKHTGQVSKLKAYLSEFIDDLGDHATEIAAIMGIELTKTVRLLVDVRYEVEMEVPLNYDEDDDLDWSVSIDHGTFDINLITDDILQIRDISEI